MARKMQKQHDMVTKCFNWFVLKVFHTWEVPFWKFIKQLFVNTCVHLKNTFTVNYYDV